MENPKTEGDRFIFELRSSKDLNSKLVLNRLLMYIFTFSGLAMVLWAFLNDTPDTNLELFYFGTTAIFAFFNLYILWVHYSHYPYPEKPKLESLIEYQLSHAERTNQKIHLYLLLGITPVYTGFIGIIAMEFKLDDSTELNKILWIDFLYIQILFGIILARALYMVVFLKKLIRRLSPEKDAKLEKEFYKSIK